MFDAMLWLEGSVYAEGLRGLGVWTYGIINLLHILGIGTLFGAVLILDLRLMGFWSSISIAVIARPTVTLAACGFFVAITSGVSIFSINATEYHGNPFFYIKLPTLVLALINIGVTARTAAWHRAVNGEASQAEDRRVLAIAGAISLLLWLIVVSCGRMIGYW